MLSHLRILLLQSISLALGLRRSAVKSVFQLSVPVGRVCSMGKALAVLDGVLHLVNKCIQQCLRLASQRTVQVDIIRFAAVPTVLPILKALE